MTAPQLALDVHCPSSEVPPLTHERRGGWMREAACRGHDPELFFPVGSNGPALMQIAEAKAVCAGCRSLAPCREFALTALPFGVAGGLSEDEREALRNRSAGTRVTRRMPSLLEQLSAEARAAAVEAGDRGQVASHWPIRVRSELVKSGGWDETVPTQKNRGGGGVRANARGRAELARYRREQAGTRVTEQSS